MHAERGDRVPFSVVLLQQAHRPKVVQMQGYIGRQDLDTQVGETRALSRVKGLETKRCVVYFEQGHRYNLWQSTAMTVRDGMIIQTRSGVAISQGGGERKPHRVWF